MLYFHKNSEISNPTLPYLLSLMLTINIAWSRSHVHKATYLPLHIFTEAFKHSKINKGFRNFPKFSSVKSLNFTHSVTENSFQYFFKYFFRPWRNVEVSLCSIKTLKIFCIYKKTGTYFEIGTCYGEYFYIPNIVAYSITFMHQLMHYIYIYYQ
jgi:hypothetical protein